MPRHRYVKSIPRLKENPYPLFDSGLSPKWLMWELYHEPISATNDERLYGNGLLRLLIKKGVLIEDFRQIEKEIKPREDDDDNPYAMYPATFDTGNTLYLLKDNLIRVKAHDDDTVTVDLYHPVSRACIIDEFKRFIIKEKGESRVSILVSRGGGLAAQKVTFAPPEIPDLELNYGAGFKKTYDAIVTKLNARKAGIILMHGAPGTGKSVLLKHLTAVVDREFIFVPVSLISRLGDPDLITLLMSKKEAVLILEDAEQAIQKRGTGGDDATVSVILNATDGILGNILNITVIASYNVDSNQIDPALTRKGRLLYEHSFQPLKMEEAKKLAAHLKKPLEVTTPMTLADIYGSGDETNHATPPPARTEMGFHTLIRTTPNPVGEEKKVVAPEKG